MRLDLFIGAIVATALAAGAAGTEGAAGADAAPIRIGQLADFSGPTSNVGTPFGQAVVDTFAWINRTGGIDGRKVELDTVDYADQVPRAMAQYRTWSEGPGRVVAIMGWGTEDTDALLAFVAKDEIPYMTGDYAASLTDPTGAGGRAGAAPYDFFYGPSYSDALRAMLGWAAADWRARGGEGQPKVVQIATDRPLATSAAEAGRAAAGGFGFDVLPDIRVGANADDAAAACAALAKSGADYAYLGTGIGATVAILSACAKAGTTATFLADVWGMDEAAAKAAGPAASGVVLPGRTAALWGDRVPGMETVEAISRMSDPSGTAWRPVHYLAGICEAMVMKSAIERAAREGDVTGPAIRKALEAMTGFVPDGLQGVCLPVTWSPTDHRGVMTVPIERVTVTGPTDAPVADLMRAGTIRLATIATIAVTRSPGTLGW